MIYIVLAAVLANVSALNPLTSAGCPRPSSIDSVSGFDGSTFSGTWYEYERAMSPMPFWESMGQCGIQQIDDQEEGLSIQWKKKIGPVGWKGSPRMAAKALDTGKLLVEYDRPLNWVFDESEDAQNYHVLATDYKSYAAVYTCYPASKGYSDIGIQSVYVYTRKAGVTLDDDIRAEITSKFRAIVPEYDPETSYYPVQGADECDYDKAF